MATVPKPFWWQSFSGFYGFANDTSPAIDSGELVSRLNTHLVPAPSHYGAHLASTAPNRVTGTDRIDLLVLNGGANFAQALGGMDYISGGAGDDVLYGGEGGDILRGGAGADMIVGGDEDDSSTGSDTASYLDAPAGITALLKSSMTFVAGDGSGSYDALYKIENIIGSDHADRIGGQGGVNYLFGGLGSDYITGAGGNDVLTGGDGDDKLKGDDGDDILIAGRGRDTIYTGAGQDMIVIDAGIFGDVAPHRDNVHDFTLGAGGDRLDVSALLHQAGYTGGDPVADKYIRLLVMNGDDIKVMFDRDGAGPAAAQHLITLANVPLSGFSAAHNLVTERHSILYAPILGQSNAKGLSASGSDKESGSTHLQAGLLALTDYDEAVSVLRDPETGQPYDLAIGGTTVDGNRNTSYGPDRVWWYPDQGRPGEILLRATDILLIQVAELRARGMVTPVIVWGQGEAEARLLGGASSPGAAVERYKDATLAVFDYIRERVGSDIEFHIMQTGRYNVDAARAAGESEQEISMVLDGLDLLRATQQDLALGHSFIHLAADYKDLRMLRESEPSEYPTDVWHLDYEDREIIGDRLAAFIAADLGYNHVIPDPGDYPVRALADLTFHAGDAGPIDGTASPDLIIGTRGQDVIHGLGGRDVIAAGAGADRLYGGGGSDTFVFEAAVWNEAFGAGPPDTSPLPAWADVIEDFTPGAGGDRIDLSILLEKAGYAGNDAFADGYVRLSAAGNDTRMRFDPDGHGPSEAVTLALLKNISPSALDPDDNFAVRSALTV